MTGTKRSPPEENVETPSRKVAKVDDSASSKLDRKKSKIKAKAIPYVSFSAQALPIHAKLTHTSAEATMSSDPGHITSVTLMPSEFTTGSYGWKGNKRIQVELQGTEGKEKERVTVMLNINATVVGSKEATNIGKEDAEEIESVEHAEE